MPTDRIIDGKDIFPILAGQQKEIDDVVYYYYRNQIYAIRKGPWKAHFITRRSYSKEPAQVHNPPLLNNLNVDPSEKYDVSSENPEVLAEFLRLHEEHQKTIDPVFSQLDLNYKK